MERYWQIEKTNLKHNIPLHLLACLLLLALSPLLMGVSNLSAGDTARTLEMYVALIGIVLLPPVFSPEQSKDVRELVSSKYTRGSSVYLLRLAGNALILAALLLCYVLFLKANNCNFPAVHYFLGTFAESLFLGGLGLFFYGLSDQLVVGYMAPLLYYIIAIGSGSKYLKLLYPFSMTIGSYKEKYALFAAAVTLLAAGIVLRCRRT